MSNDVTYLPEGSICESCIYCITRLIEPLDDEGYEIYQHGDEDNNNFIHASCIMLDIDLHDHIVRACNKYDNGRSGGGKNSIFNNKFLGI